MATTSVSSAATPTSSAKSNNEPSDLSQHIPNQWDDEIVEVTDYQPKNSISDDDSIPSDDLSNDLSGLDKAIHDEMSRIIPYPIERTYSSSDSEQSGDHGGEINELDDDFPAIDYATVDQNGNDELIRFGMYESESEPAQGITFEPHYGRDDVDPPVIDYATVDENGFDELMRFGLYEPRDKSVHGILIEPKKQHNDQNRSKTKENKSSTTCDEAVNDAGASHSRLTNIMSLMAWINEDTNTNGEAGSKECENHHGIQRSQSCSSDGSSTVIVYEGPRILNRVSDAADIETLPDEEEEDGHTDIQMFGGGDVVTLESDCGSDDNSSQRVHEDIETLSDNDDAADILTLDSQYESEDENRSERCFGENETLNDTDEISFRMLHSASIDEQADVPGRTELTGNDVELALDESNTVSNDIQTTVSHEIETESASFEKFEDPSTQSSVTTHPNGSAEETSRDNTDVPFVCENSVANRKRTSNSAKKVSKLKKFARLIKSCFGKQSN